MEEKDNEVDRGYISAEVSAREIKYRDTRALYLRA